MLLRMRNHLRDLLLAKIAASPGRDFGEKRAHADISKTEILVYNVLRFEIAGDRTLAAGSFDDYFRYSCQHHFGCPQLPTSSITVRICEDTTNNIVLLGHLHCNFV